MSEGQETRFADMSEVERLRAALLRWYEWGDPCEDWAEAGYQDGALRCGDRFVGDSHEPCLPCKLTWGANR